MGRTHNIIGLGYLLHVVTHLALVDASIGETPAQENLERETAAATTAFKASEGEVPPAPTEDAWRFDGVIISGSQASVYEDRSWIHDLTEWARQVHAGGIPTLGICWGHQFLAQALGGRIVAMDTYELGYERITRVAESPLLAGMPERFLAFETHSDRVYELPEGAELLAENDRGIQAFELGSAYGVQFHPEYDIETAEHVTRRKDLPEERIRAVMEGITREAAEAAEVATAVFENFESIVERRRC
ncbi:MAG: type 1 glutamine amidotransferase [Halodesulfurarchaeum sp.]